MLRRRGWLLLAAALVAHIASTTAQGSGVRPPQSNRPSKVHRGSGKVNRPSSSSSRYRGGCEEMPPSPMSAVIRCSTYSGCRATCMAGHQFPNGEGMIAIRCVDGEWTPQPPYEDIPDCAPVCKPVCQNGGTCIGPDVCQCAEGFSGAHCEERLEQCNEPRPTIYNARLSCSNTRCSVVCMKGHETADHRTTFEIMCTEELGWTAELSIRDDAEMMPACQPICRPKCENGGKCISFNMCQCPQQYRGPSCQWSVENCNPKTQLNFNGAYNCSGRGDQFGCQLSCPEGMEFSSPPAAIYQCDYSTGEYRPQPIPRCQGEYEVIAPTEATFVTAVVAPEPRQCALWSGKHVKTFDGQVYSFTGGCEFTAVRDSVTSLFKVSVVRGCDRPDCDWHLRLTVDRTVLLLAADEDGTVTVTQEQSLYSAQPATLAVPSEVDGLVLEKEGNKRIIVRATNIGVTIRYSREMILIQAESSLWNTVQGLCGTLDGNVYNDLLSDGLRGTLQYFSTRELCPAGDVTTELSCTGAALKQAKTVCTNALQRADVFSPCQETMGVEYFLRACTAEYCHSVSRSGAGGYPAENRAAATAAICETVTAFATECERVTSRSLSWRSEEFCPLPCPAGQVFSPCGVPAAGRCGAAVTDSWICEEGCTCPEGLLMDGDQCVEAERCSCQHNGVRHEAGESVQQDCNTCTCSAGKWLCTELACPSTCVVAGDPHYLTFDGLRYDFQGKCTYYLVQADRYNIQAENVPCSGAISEKLNYHPSTLSAEPSCTKSVRIEHEGITVDLKQDLQVLINGETPPMVPWWVDGLYIKYASSLYISVTLPNGLEVWWDGETRVEVHAPSGLTDSISGLCGNNNGNQRDDFATPEGDIEMSAIEFASKWKVDETCDDKTEPHGHPCEVYSEKYAEASTHCDRLVSMPMFQACHSVVDPAPYVKNCEYDLCSCRTELADCYCVHLADYASACAARGVQIPWRAEIGMCGKGCPFGQQYQVCGDSCGHTCFDLATASQCERHCVEGCQCPEGQALDADDRCAPISSCPCVHNNKEYRPGHRRYQGTGASLQQCECVNARWDCELSKTEKLTDNSGKCDASAHMLYVDCLPEHPVTCKSRHSSRPETTKSLYAACEPGCVCADGYVLDASSGECVTPERCPCHHGGKAYQHGATFATECRSCTCEGGMWTCEEQSCDGVCTAWGNSHYETFDGRIYDIEGDCQYLLAKGKETSKDQFEVIVTNVPCGAGSTCPKAVLIRVGHGTTLEKVALEADQPLPTTFELTRLSVRQAGAFAFVEAPSLGLVVQWDYGTRIYIRLSSQWRGKMQGLCGNFDGNPGDDFRGPSGLLENTAVQFAEQYKLQPYCPTTQPIVDSCKLHPERRLFAVRRCAALKSPVFADCHSELDVAPFFERCVQDTCACTGGGDCECLCTAVAAYGQACSRRGVHVRWRSNDLCPMQCDTECSQYSPCVSACPPKTCENRYIYEDITGMCADDTCVEGCQPKPCPSGQVYHNATLDSCVKENDCKTKCAVIGDKQLYEGDVITRDDCHVCYCTRGQQKCRGSPCPVVITTEKPPPDDDGPSPMQLGVCREGWSAWVNRNKPMAYTRPRDVERIPTFIEPTDRQDAKYAVVDLVPGTSDAVSGRITFVQKSADEPLDIVGEVEGLKPGSHGFHIHETGSTANQCSAAGGHFNPARMAHGSPMSAVRHVGDLGNIVADSFGRAQVRITMPSERISLFGKNGVIGLALVVHDAVDDLGLGAPGSGSQLTGNAGARLACGIVKKAYDVSSGVGFCADNQVTSVRCRTAGTHLNPSETGERVRCELHDGLVCDSDFVCQDYELQVLCDCSIEPTEEPPVVTTPAPPTKPPSECEEDGWTDWMSSHTPATGDWTDVEDAKSLRESHSFCEERYISAIECRTKLGHQDVKKIGGGAICDLNSGLVCSDALGYCPDFEVRFFCNCEKIAPPTPVPTVAGERCYPVGDLSAHLSDCHKFLQCNADGKQIEMSCTSTLMFDPVTEVCDWPATVVAKRPECAEITEPTTTPGPAVHCDDKKPVREHPTDCHAYYQCLRTSNGVLSEILQSCGKHMMYNPKTMTCDSVANVRALRPECAEPPPVVCKANEIYDDCKIRCDQLCHYYDGFLEAQGFCKVKDACKPGCRLSGLGYRGCPGGFVWTDEERCVRISDCNCRLPNGKPLGPGQVQVAEDGCTRVQCINNHLVYDHSSCPSSTTPSTRILENCNLWGEWIDSTNPTVGDYEAEMLPWWETFCDEGYLKEIECQETETGASYELTSDVGVTCNIKNGLACSNKAQPNGRCHNYRIRYYCSCGVDPSITTTTPTPEETTTPTETPTPTYPTVVPPEDCDVERFIPLVYGEEPLPDSAITASSAVLPEAAPAYAKILGQFQDARRSWSPTENNQNQYLQIDLGESQPVYAVKVAGNPALKAAVVKFELWISDDGEEFQPLTNDRGLPQGLTSIGALATAEPVILPTPVTARYVRMLPRTWQTRIAAKLEVYGCSRATEPPPTTTDASVVVTTVEPPPHCDEEQFIPLLYGEDTLPDSSFSASSVVGPAMAAQYAKIKGSADDKARSWTPANNDQNQYLQVDLGSVKPVYAVTVMGNKAISSAVTQFELLYSLDGSIFSYAFNPMGQQLTLTAVEPLGANPGRIILPVPVEGRYIRIHPTDWTTRITLKLELFGCSEVTPTPTPTPTPPPRCLEEMGLENGLLHDSLIEVSSSLSPEHDASAVRPGSAGWIPKQSNNKQFIKVDLTDERTIDGIVTTGVLVKGAPVPGYPGQFEPDQTRYIGSYRVRYSQDGVHWIWVYNKSGRVKVFPGHSDRTALSPMQNVFEQPLHARFVEIAPETWPEDGIGTTVELLGCYHPYPEVTTTTTPAPPDTECHLCPDVPHDSQEGCEQCGPEQHWNGTGCISGTALCPCFYNGRAYQVGSLFDLSDCQECVCQLGGSSVCERKDCPPCGGDLVSKLSESCDCQCNPCEEGTRICPTSRTCLDEEKWCDGVKQCPDDEGDECIITTPPPPTTTTTPPPLLPQYCTLKGNTFNTFDGVEYKYQICHHTLAEHEGVFDVTVHHVCEGADCHREVRITSLEEKIILVPGTGVIYGGFTYDLNQAKSIRSDLDAFEISVTPAGSILFNAPQVGFAVIVNDIGNVVVGLNNKHANEVEGLCGNFDGNRNNDKHKPDGTLAASTQAFGDSWKLPGEEQSCEVKKCNQTQQAFSICQKIRQEPFSRCHLAVQPDSFISSCLETTCACLDGGKGADECRCEALNSYVTECLSLDPSVDLDHWRTKHQCPSDCPAGEVYRDCYRPTCEPSCKHLEPCDILPDMCFSGCYCPDGQVRGDKGDCVDPVHCDDCKCGVYPGGNFETFDKEEINFNTNCSYQAAGRDEPNGKYNFRVLVDNGNCHTTYSGAVTCTDDVRVEWATNVILLQRSGHLRRDSAGRVRSRRDADDSDVAGLRKKISRLERKMGRMEDRGRTIPFKLAARMARYMARLRRLQQQDAPEEVTDGVTTAAPLTLTTTEPPEVPDSEREPVVQRATEPPTPITVDRLKAIAGALDRHSRYRPDEPVSRAFRRAEAIEKRDSQMGLRALIRLARRYESEIDHILDNPVPEPEEEPEEVTESIPTTPPPPPPTSTTVRPLTTAPPRLNSIGNIAMALRARADRRATIPTTEPPAPAVGFGPPVGIGPRSNRARLRAAAAARARERATTEDPEPLTQTDRATTEAPALLSRSERARATTKAPTPQSLPLRATTKAPERPTTEASLSKLDSSERMLVERARQFSERSPAAQLAQVFKAAMEAGSLQTFLQEYREVLTVIGTEPANSAVSTANDTDEPAPTAARLRSGPAALTVWQRKQETQQDDDDDDDDEYDEQEDVKPSVWRGVQEPLALPLAAPPTVGGRKARGTGPQVEVFVNGAMVEGFHRKYDWGSVSQPPKSVILIEVPALHLEVSLHPVSGELSVLLPSKIYGGSVGGVCGNCNGDKTDEAQRPPTFWLLDHERADQCVSEKPVCKPPPPESDPCQKLLNATVFGACHQLEDPAPLVEACQKRLCDDKQHDICDDLESYAERCFESGLCLEWRSTDLCGRDDACPPTTEYRQCAGTCLKSCEKQDCPRVEMDGCYCPEGQVYEEERCVSENRCKFCDDKGHRAGDKWKPNNCTTCECLTSDLSVRCVEVGCPDTSKVECGPYEVVAEIEGTGTECCPPHYTCRPAPSTTTTEPPVHCPEVVRPTCDAAEGKKIELLTVNGCQVAVCECVPEAECPAKLQLRPLNNGEAYRIRPDTCCPLEEIVCNKTMCRPPPECPEGFQLKQLPETAGDCCPTSVCRQPPDTCLVRLDVDIDIRSITAEMDEGFVLKRAGEVWTDGFCDNCTCREVVDGDPLYQPVCVRVACREPSAADRAEFVYEENEEGGDMCCPELVRTACRDNGKVYQPGQTWQPSIGGRPVNPCVSWTCEKDDQHGVIKVSNREKCVEDCRLGHTYVPAPPGSGQCCGECERTACVVGGVEHAEGDIWKSEDGCTEFTCERDFFDGQLTVMSMAALCRDVSDCPPENLYTDETGCCQRCNRTDNCHVKVVPPAETVRMFKQGECVNTEPVVGVINCKGACDSMAFFDTDSSTIQSGCKCCGVTATKQLDLLLTCSTGNTIYHTFTVPDGCACSKCDSSSSKLEGSSSAGAFWQQSTGEDWTQQTAGGGGIPDPWAVGGGGDPWALGGGGGGGDPDPWALGGGGGNPWDDLPFPDDNGKDAGDGGVSDSELLSLLQGAGPGANDIGTGPIH